MTLPPGLHPNVPMARYLELDAIGSTELSWLNVSPLYFRHMTDRPAREDSDTDATALGTAVHMAVLEPNRFEEFYCPEPDLDAIGGAKPRATNAYKQQRAELEASGRTVLTDKLMQQVWAMASAVKAHPVAAAVLRRAPEREMTMLWERECAPGPDGAKRTRLYRGRADMLGPGVLADLKTTKSLARFSPFELTRFGYHVQAAHYRSGLAQLGRPVEHVMLIAVETTAPYDVGVFELDQAAQHYGHESCEQLITRLDECERTGIWPGLYPQLAMGTVTDQLAAMMAGLEEAVDAEA